MAPANGKGPKLASRVAATGQMLVRSGMEIRQMLQSMCSAGAALSASLRDGELLFLSRLLRVDPEGRSIVVACSDVKPANSELFAAPMVTFGCNHEGIHYEFTVGQPREAEHAGAPAIELSFPGALLALKARKHAPATLPAELPVACEVRLGPLTFDASIVDVGLDGLAVMLYDASIRIDPGARLERVRIVHPGPALAVDLEIEEVSRIALKNGTQAQRARCRIEGRREDIEALIRLFVTDLGP